MADFRQTGFRDRHRSPQLAARHDHDPVGKIPPLGKVGRQQQDGRALGTLRDQPIADSDDSANVETPRRMTGKDDAYVAVELARNDEFLLIAAREAGEARSRAAGADVIDADSFRSRLDRCPAP